MVASTTDSPIFGTTISIGINLRFRPLCFDSSFDDWDSLLAHRPGTLWVPGGAVRIRAIARNLTPPGDLTPLPPLLGGEGE